jgi:hypothetical protein
MAAEKAAVSYDLKVGIKPDSGNIAVRGRLEIPLEDPASREFRFGLHETFAIHKLLVDGKKAQFTLVPAEFSPMTPATTNIVVTLPQGVSSDKVGMEIEYSGRLADIPEFGAFPDQKKAMDDQINAHLVELASHSSWYPQFPWGTPLQVQLALSLPRSWRAVCSGKKLEEQVKGRHAITRWVSPRDIDILILAAPNFRKKVARQSGIDIEIYHTQMPEAFIDTGLQQIADAVGFYTVRLGETNIPAGTVKQVYSPKRKGQGMAGIARPGMIVTSEGRTLDSLANDPNFSLFQGIAHEIAHFWWNFGSGQGDWINEAFAEYYSAVAVQKIVAEANFQGVLAYYRQQVRELPVDAPSLATVPFRSDRSSFVVRYYKGALMLDRLRGILGEEEFFKASHEFFQTYAGRSIGTAEFRTFWQEKLGNRRGILDTWLNSPGGLPN